MGHQRPEGSRHLVHQGDCDRHVRLARQHAGRSCPSFVGFAHRYLGRGTRTQDQHPSQAAPAPFDEQWAACGNQRFGD